MCASYYFCAHMHVLQTHMKVAKVESTKTLHVNNSLFCYLCLYEAPNATNLFSVSFASHKKKTKRCLHPFFCPVLIRLKTIYGLCVTVCVSEEEYNG